MCHVFICLGPPRARVKQIKNQCLLQGPEWAAEQAAVLGRPVPHRTLYLHGMRDGCIALDEAGATAMRGVLGPGSVVERLEGVGHFFWVEDPVGINARVLRFLAEA